MTIDWNQVSSLIVAIGTAALAIYAAFTFKGLKDQMKLLLEQATSMKRQADAMEKQSIFIKEESDAMVKQTRTMDAQFDIIREESDTMKRQADAMDGQSRLMLENMEYDRLVKKYERVNKEMTKLIAPLYARRNETNLFWLQNLTEKFSGTGYDHDREHFYYVDFWESIEQNMYLNRSADFQLAFHNYLINIIDYIQAMDNDVDKKKKKDLKDLFFETRKPDLIREIEKRYFELSKELNDLESELNKKKTNG
jgi:hypothetical protein